jgi:hypothetical protein
MEKDATPELIKRHICKLKPKNNKRLAPRDSVIRLYTAPVSGITNILLGWKKDGRGLAGPLVN